MATPAPPPTTPPAAPVAPPGLSMETERDRTVAAGGQLRVAGRLTPAVKGQRVVVRLRRGGRKVAVKAVRTDATGAWRLRVPAGGTGSVSVTASHRATPEVGTAVARALRVDVLPRRVRPGQRGAAVRLVQRHLAALGYVVGRRGTFDARTSRAVLAFRKLSGLRRTTTADSAMLRRLAAGGGRFRVRYPTHGKHVEADLSKQVIALIRGSKVERIYHTSSGKPSTPTVLGSYKFVRSEPGYNSHEMFWTRYFVGGYAIHGYKSVPVFAASHGCLRVPLSDARSIFDWIALGDRMDVYR